MRSVWTGEEVTHFLHVFPDVPLAIRTAQQEGGMKRGDQHNPTPKVVNTSAQPGDRRVGAEKRVRRKRAQRNDDLGSNRVDLTEQEGLTGRNLVRFRVAIAGRPALQDVRDIDIAPLELNR